MEYVALLQQPDKDKKKKEKTKVPEKQSNSPTESETTGAGGRGVEPPQTIPQPSIGFEPNTMLPGTISGMVSSPGMAGTTAGVVGSGPGVAGTTAGVVSSGPSMAVMTAGVVGSGPSMVVTTAGVVGSGPSAATTPVPSNSGQPESDEENDSLLRFNDRESQRLTSETHRLLQCHAEHAMTIAELVQSFTDARDPARPQAEELSLCLHKHNAKRGGSKSPKIFQV